MSETAVRVLSWNLFHGRDHPPEPELRTWRSRLLGTTERGAEHAQVNCDLLDRFADLLAGAEWDVALLQECPPRWAERLATACGADAHLVPTSRNIPLLGRRPGVPRRPQPRPDRLLGGRLEPDPRPLVRRGRAGDRRAAQPPARHPARAADDGVHPARHRAFASPTCTPAPSGMPRSGELPDAARVASGWARGSPLILGGDFNLRPRAERVRLRRPRARPRPRGADGAEGDRPPPRPRARGGRAAAPVACRSAARSPTRRRAGVTVLPIRLSDHAPVEAALRRCGYAQPAQADRPPGRTRHMRRHEEDRKRQPAARPPRRSAHRKSAAESPPTNAEAASRRDAQAQAPLRRSRRQERRAVPRRARTQRHALARADPGGRRRRGQARPDDSARTPTRWSPSLLARGRKQTEDMLKELERVLEQARSGVEHAHEAHPQARREADLGRPQAG